jgi:hypothetical protein
MPNPYDGMTLVFSDTFTYSGSPPVDPTKWYIGDPRPGHAGFSNAKFIQLGDANINSVFTGGGGSPLTINACYDTAFNATYGTDWLSGLISTAFADGSGAGVRQGYFEVVITAPYDPNAQGVSGGTGTGSGTWIGFWLLDQRGILGDATYGTREVDTELYGVGNNQYPATSQWWTVGTPTATPGSPTLPFHAYWQWQVGGGGPGSPTVANFQGVSTTFGMLVDQFNVTWYVDGVAQVTLPLFEPDATDPLFMMIDLGMGGGWPIVPPVSPATSYPLIVTSAKIWEAPMTTVTGVGYVSTVVSGSTMTLTYATPPTFTSAGSPSTSGSAVTIGTVAVGLSGDTLTVTLTSDPTFSSGSSLAISSGNLVYTPGTITSGNAGTDTIAFTLNESNGASASFTQAVTLTYSGGGSIALVNSAACPVGGGTSSGVDTTGATLLVVTGVYYGGGTTASVTDNKSNTWTKLTVQDNSVAANCIWYSHATTVGTGHTVTFTGDYSIAEFMAFSGVSGSPFDKQGGNETANGTAATTFQPGSLTPSANGSLIVVGLGNNSFTGTISIDSSFTIAGQHTYNSGVNYGAATAYLIQTTAAAVDPTWTMPSTGGTYLTSAMAVFK